MRKRISEYHDFVCAAAVQTFEHLDEKTEKGVPQQEDMPPMPSHDFTESQSFPVLQPQWFSSGLPKAQRWPFTDLFLERLLLWWERLQWIPGGQTSALEMYVDFALHSQSHAPVCMQKQGYKLRDSNIAADSQPQTMAGQSVVWIRVLRWLIKRIATPDFDLCKTAALSRYGYSIPSAGFPFRVKLLHGSRVHQELWRYFHVGHATIRDLQRIWRAT